MNKLYFLFVATVSLFASEFDPAGINTESFITNFSMSVITASFAVVMYGLYFYAQKYKLDFMLTYIETVVKRVEQEVKSKAKIVIPQKYHELSESNQKLAYALSLIEKDYSGFLGSFYGYILGMFDNKVISMIESKVLDLKK